MKAIILTLLAGIASCSSVLAQHFNTITNAPSRYKVETANDTLVVATQDTLRCVGEKVEMVNDTPVLTTTNEQDTSPQGDVSNIASKAFMASDAQKQEWIDRYLSVAYPLRNIKINSSYGYRADPITGKRKFHNGIDLQARNEEAYAMFSGTVCKVGQDKTSGKYVVLQHGDIRISYCHLSQVLTTKGTIVHPGDIIGITGSTGRSTGPHLHLTCKFHDRPLNPTILLDYIKATRLECKEFTAR